LGEAIAAFEQAITLRPNYPEAFSQLLGSRQHACDWTDYVLHQERLLEIVRQGGRFPPFILLSVASTAVDQLLCARQWAERISRQAHTFQHPPRPQQARIRLGYLSSDFREHATAHLMAELFEQHDRSCFELIGYSCGPNDGSAMRARLTRAFDRFVDLRPLSHTEAARVIHQDGIGILVDLKGYTQHARTEILAHRPAPIQVNYLGYPGTMGADFIDYLIADPFVAPMEQQAFYTEKLVHLPDCYQPNDTKRRIAEPTPSRAECGLPEQGFVFCCFNNSYKITPSFFEIWMRLLQAVPGSVLWLLEANGLAKKNLRQEAQARGVNPERLVFAPRKPLPEHLARHRQADLFLDTLPFNAHTTTSDALWAGLPVLTCVGKTFAGRVAGSLLQAIGLSDLITGSLSQYEALALSLATQPQKLAEVRRKLEGNKSGMPLFDVVRFTRNIEASYTRMWKAWCSGQEPTAFTVESKCKTRL
jgi:predicted O-linked N-acetylglucosamine transferase (SPINDLY family)